MNHHASSAFWECYNQLPDEFEIVLDRFVYHPVDSDPRVYRQVDAALFVLHLKRFGVATFPRSAETDNMVFTQIRGFVFGRPFGLRIRSLRCRFLVCNAEDTASLATRVLFAKLNGVATTFGFGEKRCRKKLPLSGRAD